MISEAPGATGAGGSTLAPDETPNSSPVPAPAVPAALPEATAPVACDAPFPLHSVLRVTVLAWRLCLSRDPIGLLAVPFVIFFPVYVFVSVIAFVLYPLIQGEGQSQLQSTLLVALPFALPVVAFARFLGEAWIIVRSDADAHGKRLRAGETFVRALKRSWDLFVVVLSIYALGQIGFYLGENLVRLLTHTPNPIVLIFGVNATAALVSLVFLVPAAAVWIYCSFGNQAAVLGPGRLLRSLRYSREVLRGNFRPWLGMVALWGLIFFVAGAAVRAAGSIVARVLGRSPGFAFDLVLRLPLPLILLVFTSCWTLFFRELEARAHARAPEAAPVPDPGGPEALPGPA